MAYLDHAATTTLRPEALAALEHAHRTLGNPASIHAHGRHARALLEDARESLADVLRCEPIEVVFTSGGTESVNFAIKGMFWASKASRVIFPAGEHHATIDSVTWLEQACGARGVELGLDSEGLLAPELLADALTEGDNALFSTIWANNEIGALQPVAKLAQLASAAGVQVHIDAVATFGHAPVDFSAFDGAVSALSLSAHKIGGPVGVGALVVARAAKITPLLHGGGQQRDIRSGTQDTAGAYAFAAAAVAMRDELFENAVRHEAMRERLIAAIRAITPAVIVNGPQDQAQRLSSTLHLTFPGCSGDTLLYLLDAKGVSVSTGSACQAGVPEPSHVLLALGESERTARSCIRLTLGHDTTDDHIDEFLAALPSAYAQALAAGHP